MPLECIGYPEEGVFSVSVSTSKESSYHVPTFHTYNFLLTGRCESLYYQALSTPPVWVATIVAMDELSVQMFLSTPPVWVATAKVYKRIIRFCAIRIIFSFLFAKMQYTAKQKITNHTLQILLFNDFSAKPPVKLWYLLIRTYSINTSSCANSG